MKKWLALLLTLTLLVSFLPVPVKAEEYELLQNRTITVDGEQKIIKTLSYAYENNVYVSIRDFGAALAGTGKEFSVSVSKASISMNTNAGFTYVGGENTGFGEEELSQSKSLVLKRNDFSVNDDKKRYYSLIGAMDSGAYDGFVMVVDLAMILDVKVQVGNDGSIQVDTTSPFEVDPQVLEADGYFQGVNSVLVGDATSGEIYYGFNKDTAFPIASTTKLMTYLVVMDAVTSHKIGLDDMVTCSKKVAQLAASSDGVINLTQGQQITVRELLTGLLLPSSNESALALAEYVSGSESDFVTLMNNKAMEIGLLSAEFYNCNGLPSYTDALVPSKRQNHMCAEDMFTLVKYILNIYPQITEITSMKKGELPSLGIEVNNTNPVLYNMAECNGLKTGTTNKAGYCLVTGLKLDGSDGSHEIVVVLLGAEGAPDRGRVSEILARYGKSIFTGQYGLGDGMAEYAKIQTLSQDQIPTNAEDVVKLMVEAAKRKAGK